MRPLPLYLPYQMTDAYAYALLQHMALQQHVATRDAMSLHSPEDLVHLRLNNMLPNIEVHHDS